MLCEGNAMILILNNNWRGAFFSLKPFKSSKQGRERQKVRLSLAFIKYVCDVPFTSYLGRL